jgi:ABC-type multidrug transport system fused ATPase/permease subunit
MRLLARYLADYSQLVVLALVLAAINQVFSLLDPLIYAWSVHWLIAPIYTREITVGQFFSLFIYSFFIFGPLQELGNIINIYREAEVSLKNFQDILEIKKEPRPLNPSGASSLTLDAVDRCVGRDRRSGHCDSAQGPLWRRARYRA